MKLITAMKQICIY